MDQNGKTNFYDKTGDFSLQLPGGGTMPRLGQGTWMMGENERKRLEEVDALRYGLDLGMDLIDSAEMYADGVAESISGEAIRGRNREDIFLVSKVYPWNAGRDRIFQSCEATLKRFGVETLDLYLLHWREDADLSEMVWCMEKLIEQRKIRRWGVSNFDTDDMADLFRVPDGRNCAVNQVLYNLGSRGIEYDLIPWQREREIPFMAYCPVAQGGSLREELLNSRHVIETAKLHDATPIQILLSFVLRLEDMAAIPKAVKREHVLQNSAVNKIKLTVEDIERLSASFPAPTRKMPMEKV
jgi:diketogulonate reductase-like aldo/keto reductase